SRAHKGCRFRETLRAEGDLHRGRGEMSLQDLATAGCVGKVERQNEIEASRPEKSCVDLGRPVRRGNPENLSTIAGTGHELEELSENAAARFVGLDVSRRPFPLVQFVH